MKARFDAGTDVAMLGAWDVQRGAAPFSAEEYNNLSETLDADATAGHVFLVHTHADGGGPVDVYVGEPIPGDVLPHLTPLGDEFILALPSGALVVDGAEYYRARKPDVDQAKRAVSVPAGDYALRCYVTNDEEAEGKPPHRPQGDLESVVGRDELRYYERVTRGGCLTGALLLLLLPALWPIFGVKVAFAVTVVVVVAYFNIREWVLRRSARFSRLRQTITAFRLEQRDPDFVLELRAIDSRAGLSGGSVSL